MNMVSDTSYDAYLEGIDAAKNEEQLAEKLTKIEDELEDVRHQIQTIEENCTYYVQDGQTRIKGYALEEQFDDLLAQEEDLLLLQEGLLLLQGENLPLLQEENMIFLLENDREKSHPHPTPTN